MKFYKKVDDYYKDIKDNIQSKLDINKEYEYIFDGDTVNIMLNNKIKIKAEYNIVGLYNIGLSVWYWGYSIDFINKKFTEKLDIIRKFPIILEKDSKEFSSQELEELHFMTSNTNFYCSGQNIDRIIKFVLFMTNSVWFVPIKNSDKIEYIILTKILQIN